MMIRNSADYRKRKIELKATEETIEKLRNLYITTKPHTPVQEASHLGTLRRQEKYYRYLKEAINDYQVTEGATLPAIIPCQRADSTPGGIADALRTARLCSKHRTQESFAKQLERGQSHVAQLESPVKGSYMLETLIEWGEASGYDLDMYFVSRDKAFNDPAAIYRLAMVASALKGKYRDRFDAILDSYMRHLQDALHADIATCFVNDPCNNRLVMVYQDGATRPEVLNATVRRDESPAKMLHGDVECITDVSDHGTLGNSQFCKREGISSAIVIPFALDGERGVIFLSYTKAPREFCEDYKAAIKMLSHITSMVLSGMRIHHSTAPDDEDSAAFRRLVADIRPDESANSSNSVETSVSQILRYTLHDRFELPDATCFYYEHCNTGELKMLSQVKGTPFYYPDTTNESLLKCIAERRDFYLEDETTGHECELLSKFTACDPLFDQSMKHPRSLLTVRCKSDGSSSFDGVIVLLSSQPDVFRARKDYFVKALDGVGSTIARMQRTREVVSRRLQHTRKDSQRRKEIYTLLNHIALAESGVASGLEATAQVMQLLWSASAVDIWPYDWSTRSFIVSEGVSVIAESLSACTKMDEHSIRQRFCPRAGGLSEKVLFCEDREVLGMRWADRDSIVNPSTVGLGIKSLIAAPIYGPEAVRSEGIIWARFGDRPEQDIFRRCMEEIKAFAGFTHLIWNPTYYEFQRGSWCYLSDRGTRSAERVKSGGCELTVSAASDSSTTYELP